MYLEERFGNRLPKSVNSGTPTPPPFFEISRHPHLKCLHHVETERHGPLQDSA